MDGYLEFAKAQARQAGKIIKANFAKKHQSEAKADATPVTVIDKQINQMVMDAVAAKYPDHGFLGEEGQRGSGREKYQWLCDPIDATKAFILNIPNSVFMLALMSDGQILLSVVYDPHVNRLYHAIKGRGAFCNDEPIHVNDHQLKGGYLLVGEVNTAAYAEALEKTGMEVELVTGTGYRCMMLASGRGSGIIKIDRDNHDIGVASLIIEEAGGKITDLDGESMRYDRLLNGAIISNGVIHDELLKVVQSVQSSK